jgi:hypothetical protein
MKPTNNNITMTKLLVYTLLMILLVVSGPLSALANFPNILAPLAIFALAVGLFGELIRIASCVKKKKPTSCSSRKRRRR